MPNLDSLEQMGNQLGADTSSLSSLPPWLQNYIQTHSSYGEGEMPSSSTGWPYPFRGSGNEGPGPGGARDQALLNHMLKLQQGAPTHNISYQPQGGGAMNWNQLTPQQQQMLLQMLMSRGAGGMQMGSNTMQQGMPGMQGQAMPGAQAGAASPLTQQSPQMQQMLLQYLMGQGGGGGGLNLAQLLGAGGGMAPSIGQ